MPFFREITLRVDIRKCLAVTLVSLGLIGSHVRNTFAAGGYPTSAVAEYVLVCMKANGETRDALERCSCSIDVITSLLPYQRYETAETFKRMAQLTGENGSVFRDSATAKSAKAELSRAEIEAEVRCF
jgi:hypothetical protein